MAAILLATTSLALVVEHSDEQEAEFVTALLMDDLKDQSRLDLQLSSSRLEDLRAQLDQATGYLAAQSNLIAFVEKSQPEPAHLMLKRFAHANEIDFAVIFEADGSALASASDDLDRIQVTRQFADSPLFEHIQPTMVGDDPRSFSGYARFSDVFADPRLVATDHPHRAQAYGPVSVMAIIDDFGDLLGWVVAGKTIDRLQKLFEETHRAAGVAFVSFVDGIPYFTTGFAATPAPLTTVESNDVFSDGTRELSHMAGDDRYLLSCRPAFGFDERPLSIHCSGFPLEPALQTTQAFQSFNDDANRWILITLLTVTLGTLAALVLASTILASRITRPIRDTSRALFRLAENDLAVPIPNTADIAELRDLSAAMETFRENANKRREAEEKLIQTNAALENHVAALEIERSRAQSSEVAKREFLSALTHELRTPLNAIIGFSQVLAATMGRDPAHSDLAGMPETILENGHQMLTLVDDLIAVAQSEHGAMRLRESKLDLRELIRLTYVQLLPEANQKGVSLIDDTPTELPEVIGDADRLRLVFRAILDNGIKFTPPQGKVEITGRVNEQGGVSIVISDTGIGMDQAAREAATSLFKQAEAGYSRRFSGMGVGFYLANAIVELHAGSVTLESAPGEGTRVSINLPAERIVRRTRARRTA